CIACAIPHAIDRLLATPTTKARFPSSRLINYPALFL
ncbi:MAG: hypothetical protein ACI909_000812, partial [Planctomycetota bacterium]